LAPENTLPSFDLAVSQGVDALELDIRLARDGVAVVMHDATLDRTTNATGPVALRSAAELAAVDAGHWFTADRTSFPFRERGTAIPTLRQVLERYRLPLLIELKVVEAVAAVREELVRAGAERRAVIASFRDRAVGPFRTGASRSDIIRQTLRSWIGAAPARPTPRCYAVPFRYKDRFEVPTQRFVTTARQAGRPVHVWTVDEPALARMLWERGVSGIVTNHPPAILAERGRIPAI
jgi:glycerophosphoryl diester phosphodiesterase